MPSSIAGYLKKDAQGQWRLALPPDLSALYGQGLDGLSYAVRRGSDGRLIVISGKDSDAALVAPRSSLSHMSRDGAQVYAVLGATMTALSDQGGAERRNIPT